MTGDSYLSDTHHLLPGKINQRHQQKRATHKGKDVVGIDKKVEPAKVLLAKILVEQYAYTTQVAEGIGHIDEEPGGAYVFESSDHPFKEDTVKRDVSNIGGKTCKHDPHNRTDNVGLIKEGADARGCKTGKYNDMVDQ